MNPVTLDEIIHEPGFSAIKAITTNQVYLVDEEQVSRPTMHVLEAAVISSNTLYPELEQYPLCVTHNTTSPLSL